MQILSAQMNENKHSRHRHNIHPNNNNDVYIKKSSRWQRGIKLRLNCYGDE